MSQFQSASPGWSWADLIARLLPFAWIQTGVRRRDPFADSAIVQAPSEAASASECSRPPVAEHRSESSGRGEGEPGAVSELTTAAAARPRLKILIADDNRTAQQVIAKILENAGHETRAVEDGAAAVEALSQDPFDVILMDTDMPIMNGIEAAKSIRSMTTGRARVPIVALQADDGDGGRKRCEAAGIDASIAKPADPAGLIKILEEVTSVADAARRSRLPLPTDTGSQPETRSQGYQALDVRTLESLKSLGGVEFVQELAQQFLDDAVTVLDELSQAVAQGCPQAFREHAHALRSGAANIGAQGIYAMCLAWRHIETEELAAKGNVHIAQLQQELTQVRQALQQYRNAR